MSQRLAVQFHCTSCGQPVTCPSFYLRVKAPTATLVKRFCSLTCLQAWLPRPRQ